MDWFKENVKTGDTVKLQYHSQYREAIVDGKRGAIRMGHTHVMNFKEIREFNDYEYPQTYLVCQINGVDEPILLEDVMDLLELNGVPVKQHKKSTSKPKNTTPQPVPGTKTKDAASGRFACPETGCTKDYANAGALYNHRKRVGH